MRVLSYRGLALPVGALVCCAAALSAPQRARPFWITFAVIAGVVSMMPRITRTQTESRAVAIAPTTADDAADLVRMDDDGWQSRRPSGIQDHRVSRQRLLRETNQRIL